MYSVGTTRGYHIGKFLIRHKSSGKYMHPYGGSKVPGNNTPMVIYPGYHEACYFHFFPVKDYPGYGVIRQASSDRYIHPLGGSTNPGNNNQIVYY